MHRIGQQSAVNIRYLVVCTTLGAPPTACIHHLLPGLRSPWLRETLSTNRVHVRGRALCGA